MAQPTFISGNSIERLLNADQAYPAMIQAIEQARSSILFSNYCMIRGSAINRFFEPLKQAAKRGVGVTILIDAHGSKDNDPAQLAALKTAGVKLIWFRPMDFSHILRINNRLHKKLLIIDGQTLYTGGIGVGDYWIGDPRYPQAWRDTHFKITGPIVSKAVEAFNASLRSVGEQHIPIQTGKGTDIGAEAAVTDSNPSSIGKSEAEDLVTWLIKQATDELTITTAYFGPPLRIRRALIKAAQRGVRVRILTNGPYTTHHYAIEAGRHSYWPLLQGGIEIYEYQPTMIHAKIITVDDRLSSFGSINLNFRSFKHDQECNVTAKDPKLTKLLVKDFEADLKKATKIGLTGWKRRPAGTKLKQTGYSLGRVFF